MEAVRIHEYGSRDVLRVDTVDRPELNLDEVLIEVAAIGVNPVDVHVREGYRATPDNLGDIPGPDHRGMATPEGLPRIPGTDVAGKVIDVGGNVDRFGVGDRVFGTGLHNDRMGTYAEYIAARPDRLAHLPEGVSFEDGGAVGAVAGTAWRALIHHGDLGIGDGCLVHGATGGVGHVAVQIAARAGARVVGTSRPAVHELVRDWGAQAAVDYDHDDVVGEVRAALDAGADVVLDHMAGDLLGIDVAVAGFDGRVVVVGDPEEAATVPSIRDAMQNDLTVKFIGISNTPQTSDLLERIARLMREDALAVEIHETFPLSSARRAHEVLETESVIGKLVLTP